MSGFRHLDEEVRHQGFIWRVVVAEFEGPDGQRFRRDIVRSPGAVGIVPLLDGVGGVEGVDGVDRVGGVAGVDGVDGVERPAVILVRQFRPAVGADVVEIPAGMRDVPGEPPIDTALRELREEIGYEADLIEPLTVMHPSVGMTDSTTHLFVARGLRFVSVHRHGPEEAAMTTSVVPLDDAVAMVERGEVTDAKTALALLLVARRLAARRLADDKAVGKTASPP